MLCWSCAKSKMYRASFWMKHWGAATWKRTVLVSNTQCVGQFDRGPLRRKVGCDFKSATHYKDKAGKKCYTGTQHLKQTGPWAVSCTCSIYSLYTLVKVLTFLIPGNILLALPRSSCRCCHVCKPDRWSSSQLLPWLAQYIRTCF